MSVKRTTVPTTEVLRAFMVSPTEDLYGYQLIQMTGLPSGTLYPILARLEFYGWVESRWEELDPEQEARPRRRYYRLSQDGLERVGSALAAGAKPDGRTRRLVKRSERLPALPAH